MSYEELEDELDKELKLLKRTEKWKEAKLILDYDKLGADIRPFLQKDHTPEELKLIIIKVNRMIFECKKLKKRKIPEKIREAKESIIKNICNVCGGVN